MKPVQSKKVAKLSNYFDLTKMNKDQLFHFDAKDSKESKGNPTNIILAQDKANIGFAFS